MFYNFKATIPYYEFSSEDFIAVKKDVENNKKNDIRKCAYKKAGKIEISRFRLSIAIAKSLYSKVPDLKIMKQIAYSYFIQLPFLLFSKNGKLYLDFDNLNLFRDFSKSCRDGEIAQGICYLLAKYVLHAVTVDDFKYYCYKRNNYLPKCTSKTPDYIFTKSDGSISLLEVKGICAADPTQPMTYGMNQCNNGELYLKKKRNIPSNKYVSVVTFASSKNRKRSTEVYFSDPPSGFTNTNNTLDIFRGNVFKEYAKFMYIAGDETLHNMVYEDNLQPKDLNKYYNYFKEILEKENDNPIYEEAGYQKNELISISKRRYSNLFDNDEYEVEFGITRKAAEYFSEPFSQVYNNDSQNSVYKIIENKQIKEDIKEDIKGGIKGDLEIFPDGTFMCVYSRTKGETYN